MKLESVSLYIGEHKYKETEEFLLSYRLESDEDKLKIKFSLCELYATTGLVDKLFTLSQELLE